MQTSESEESPSAHKSLTNLGKTNYLTNKKGVISGHVYQQKHQNKD